MRIAGRANLKPSAPIAYRKMFGISGSPLILNANWPTSVVNVPPRLQRRQERRREVALPRCDAAIMS